MRHTLHAYMAMKPIRSGAGVKTARFGWFMSLRPAAAVLVAAVFIASGGVSYAAEAALPGDFLYAVKTRVNEPLAGALALTAPAKTAWAMEVAGKRVQEAATLAAGDKLDATTESRLLANFSEHAQEAIDAIDWLSSISPDLGTETAVRFEARLSEYARLLAQITSSRNTKAEAFALAVTEKEKSVAVVRAQAETYFASDVLATSSGTIALSHIRDAARSQLDTSERLARKSNIAFAPSSAESIQYQLANASSTISDGEHELSRNATPVALGAFRSALAAAEKLSVFLQTSSSIHRRTGLVIAEPRGETSSARVRSALAPAVAPKAAAPIAQEQDSVATMAAPQAMAVITATSSEEEIQANRAEPEAPLRAAVESESSLRKEDKPDEAERSRGRGRSKVEFLQISVPTSDDSHHDSDD